IIGFTHLNSPVNVFSHRPAFQSLMVLSADPVSMRPCSGNMTTAHTAAAWPCSNINKQTICSVTLLIISMLATVTGIRYIDTDTSTYLQCHHALLIEPDSGCGVPGAAQKCPKLPR
uniref:Uncharacterized protein n=1 Tax=Lates calcarifer TaxID=8187 RepID=A0A4W6EHU7_LATCA